jgi:hypothetical protein
VWLQLRRKRPIAGKVGILSISNSTEVKINFISPLQHRSIADTRTFVLVSLNRRLKRNVLVATRYLKPGFT